MSLDDAGVIAAQIVDVENVPDDRKYTTTSGAIIRFKPLSQMTLRRISERHKAPEVPIIEVEKGGKKDKEPNPNDPKYLAALEEYQAQVGAITINLVFLSGFDVIQAPPDVPDMNSPEFIDTLELLGIIPKTFTERRLCWLEMFIAPETVDILNIQQRVTALSSVTEAEVKAQIDRFQGDTGRPTSR